MHPMVAQCVSIVVLIIGTSIVGLSTLSLRRLLCKNPSDQGRKGVVCSTLLFCVSAGALLATTFLHILPATRQGVQGVASNDWLAELVLCAGFFLGYVLEEVIHMANEKEPISDEATKDNQKQSDMEMNETDSTNPKYNPKYEVRLSMSTNDMFPTYHTPEATEDKTDEVSTKANHDSAPTTPASRVATQVRLAITGFMIRL